MWRMRTPERGERRGRNVDARHSASSGLSSRSIVPPGVDSIASL
jgi:hypothetical protein